MPIYYGCTQITDYFPAESMIQIDIQKPKAAIDKIQKAVANKAWQHNIDAIAYARELILNKYQFFPLMARQIQQFESTHGTFLPKQQIIVKASNAKEPLWSKAGRKINRLLDLFLGRFK